MSYVGIKTNPTTLIPKIIEVDFRIVGEYIYIIKGAVTGYESANVKEITNEYIEKSSFSRWIACFGTLNKWSRLEIPVSEIIKYLIDNKYIVITKEYGYIKEIKWIVLI